MKKKATRPDWKKPKEMLLRSGRHYFHARLPRDLVVWIDEHVHEAGIDRTTFVETCLNDYRAWLEGQRAKSRAAVS